MSDGNNDPAKKRSNERQKDIRNFWQAEIKTAKKLYYVVPAKDAKEGTLKLIHTEEITFEI